MAAGVIDLTAIPRSRDGFYATNYQFQVRGKKGFTEFKHLENDDLPSVPNNGFKYVYDAVRKGVIFIGESPKENKHDNGGRKYIGGTGLTCSCCELIGVKPIMQDGVLRMILQKKKINRSETETTPDQQGILCPCIVGPYPQPSDNSSGSDRVLENQPCLLEGPKGAFESKPLKNGGLYVRIHLPGVAKEDVKDFVQDGEVRFCGHTKRVMHDESSRDYLGSISLMSGSKKIGRKIKSVVKNGVLRMTIPTT